MCGGVFVCFFPMSPLDKAVLPREGTQMRAQSRRYCPEDCEQCNISR